MAVNHVSQQGSQVQVQQGQDVQQVSRVQQVHDAISSTYVQRLIRDKACQLRRRPEFMDVDSADIRQELVVHILQGADQYDPARGAAITFCTRVVAKSVAMMCRDRKRIKRGAEVSVWSLEAVIGEGEEGEDTTLGDVVYETDLTRRSGNLQPDAFDSQLLALDVATALAHLSEETREIARLMSDEVCEFEIAARLGVGRRHVRNAIATIRACLEVVGKENGQNFDQTA